MNAGLSRQTVTESTIADVPMSENGTTFGDVEVAGIRVDGDLDGSFEGGFASWGGDDGLDNPRREMNSAHGTDASVAVGDEEISFSVEGEGSRFFDVGFLSRFAIAVESFFARTGNCLDDSVGSNASDAVVHCVGDVEVACRVEDDGGRTIESSTTSRTPVAAETAQSTTANDSSGQNCGFCGSWFLFPYDVFEGTDPVSGSFGVDDDPRRVSQKGVFGDRLDATGFGVHPTDSIAGTVAMGVNVTGEAVRGSRWRSRNSTRFRRTGRRRTHKEYSHPYAENHPKETHYPNQKTTIRIFFGWHFFIF